MYPFAPARSAARRADGFVLLRKHEHPQRREVDEQVLEQLHSVFTMQTQVQDDQVGPAAGGGFETRLAGVRLGAASQVGLGLDDAPQAVPNERVVIDNENAALRLVFFHVNPKIETPVKRPYIKIATRGQSQNKSERGNRGRGNQPQRTQRAQRAQGI